MSALQRPLAAPPLYHAVAQVPVVPGVKPIKAGTKGGPIWPDIDAYADLRHCRNGRPVDLTPDRPSDFAETLPAAVWGCFLDLRFGHLVAEHLSRLPLAVRQWPDLPVLFAAPEGVERADLPSWVWEIFAWIGLDADRVRVVTRPVLVERLFACCQQETMFKVRPSQAYLDLLTGLTARLPAQTTGLLYVSRQGLVAEGRGGHAGEAYLIRLLQETGVSVLDPRQCTVMQQLHAYAGARTIVFVEGSAVHGRQLLGHVSQDIHILRRRDGHSIARQQLAPRCRKLRYRDVAGPTLPVYRKNGPRRDESDLRLYDLEGLWNTFATLGVQLQGKWREAEYRAAVVKDLEAWAAVRKPRRSEIASFGQTLREARMLPASWYDMKKPAPPEQAAVTTDSDR